MPFSKTFVIHLLLRCKDEMHAQLPSALYSFMAKMDPSTKKSYGDKLGPNG